MKLSDLCPDRAALVAFEQRFFSKVDVRGDDECWPWTACCCAHGKARLGYGRFGLFRGRVMTAHRVSYLLAVGEVPDHLFVCHDCDNPPCCNPAHLWAGTGKQNAADRDAKGRWRGGRTLLLAERAEAKRGGEAA